MKKYEDMTSKEKIRYYQGEDIPETLNVPTRFERYKIYYSSGHEDHAFLDSLNEL